jgi:putative redox protein
MTTVTAHIGQARYATTLRTAHHEITADEPPEHGGSDAGFAPSELLAASLAACTSITLRMYADRKQWPLEAAEVEVSVEREAAAKSTFFTRKIRLLGTLEEEQRERLLDIANKCPIHQTLSQSITIHSSLA